MICEIDKDNVYEAMSLFASGVNIKNEPIVPIYMKRMEGDKVIQTPFGSLSIEKDEWVILGANKEIIIADKETSPMTICEVNLPDIVGEVDEI